MPSCTTPPVCGAPQPYALPSFRLVSLELPSSGESPLRRIDAGLWDRVVRPRSTWAATVIRTPQVAVWLRVAEKSGAMPESAAVALMTGVVALVVVAAYALIASSEERQ